MNNVHSKKVLTLSASNHTHFKKHIIDDGQTNSTISVYCKKQKIALKGEREQCSQYLKKKKVLTLSASNHTRTSKNPHT